MPINQYIDHTLLKPESTQEQIDHLLSEAVEYQFASVCVNPTWVAHCSKTLAGTGVKVCTVVGFPLGAKSITGIPHMVSAVSEILKVLGSIFAPLRVHYILAKSLCQHKTKRRMLCASAKFGCKIILL